MELLGDLFMVYDIVIHQLNLEKNKNLQLLGEIPFKNVFFCLFLVMST
jgi:hypothetical protein